MEAARRRVDGEVPQEDIQDVPGAAVEDSGAVSKHGAVCRRLGGSETALRRSHGVDKSFDWVGEYGQGVCYLVGCEWFVRRGTRAWRVSVVCRLDSHGPLLCSADAVFGLVGANVLGEAVQGSAGRPVESRRVPGAEDADGEDTDGHRPGTAPDSTVSYVVCGSSKRYFLILGDYVCAQRRE